MPNFLVLLNYQIKTIVVISQTKTINCASIIKYYIKEIIFFLKIKVKLFYIGAFKVLCVKKWSVVNSQQDVIAVCKQRPTRRGDILLCIDWYCRKVLCRAVTEDLDCLLYEYYFLFYSSFMVSYLIQVVTVFVCSTSSTTNLFWVVLSSSIPPKMSFRSSYLSWCLSARKPRCVLRQDKVM